MPLAPDDGHEEQRLFEHLHGQHQFGMGQFATSLIGLGALFFAYGQIASPFVRLIIAIVGLGASSILWITSFAARYEAWAFEEEIGATDKRLMDRYKRARSWRNVGWPGWLYPSTLRLIIYFNGLLALAWFSVIIYGLRVDYGWGVAPQLPYVIDVSGLSLAVLLWLTLRKGSFMTKVGHPLVDPDWLDLRRGLPPRPGYPSGASCLKVPRSTILGAAILILGPSCVFALLEEESTSLWAALGAGLLLAIAGITVHIVSREKVQPDNKPPEKPTA